MTVTNKNDDAESDEEEDNDLAVASAPRKDAPTAKADKEKQPTGRVVGIIKRNWRA
jgi:exosome complex exonuclease DIS3/RRP44